MQLSPILYARSLSLRVHSPGPTELPLLHLSIDLPIYLFLYALFLYPLHPFLLFPFSFLSFFTLEVWLLTGSSRLPSIFTVSPGGPPPSFGAGHAALYTARAGFLSKLCLDFRHCSARQCPNIGVDTSKAAFAKQMADNILRGGMRLVDDS